MEGSRALASIPTSWLEVFTDLAAEIAWTCLLAPALRARRELDLRAIEEEDHEAPADG